MSRSLKIVKLLEDNKENSCENIKQLFVEKSSNSNILQENPLESGPDDEKPAPLPPGAGIIISELSDIAHDVFSSPFTIEDANTSFEAFPPVIIEEFEDDVVGTPKSPLRIPIPIPSPTNSHRNNCGDIFCGADDSWIEALPSSPDTVSGVSSMSESDTSPVSSLGRKKHKKCKVSWSDVKSKCLTN